MGAVGARMNTMTVFWSANISPKRTRAPWLSNTWISAAVSNVCLSIVVDFCSVDMNTVTVGIGSKDCWRVDELWQLIVARAVVVAWIESYPSLRVNSLHINPINYQRNSKVQTREFSGAKFDLCGPLPCQKVDLVHFPAPFASIGPWRRFTSNNHVTVRTWCERKLFYACSVWGLRPPEERRRTWLTARCNPQAWLCSVICYRRRVPSPVRQGPLYSCLAYVSKWVLEGRCCW